MTLRAVIILLLIGSSILAQSLSQRLALDHINIAVADLEAATALSNDSLGFAIKPGRLHDNSINNAHLKFKNGTSIELITAEKPADALAEHYLQKISAAPNGSLAFMCLRLTDRAVSDSLLSHFPLQKSDLGFAEIFSFPLTDARHPLFFIRYKKSVSDNPRYLYHWNGAKELGAVLVSRKWWLMHFSDFGTTTESRQLSVRGQKLAVDVVSLAGGEIWLVDDKVPARSTVKTPLLGLSVSVDDLPQTIQFLQNKLPEQVQMNPLNVFGTFLFLQQ